MTEKPKGAERYRLGTASYLSLVETVTQYLQYFFFIFEHICWGKNTLNAAKLQSQYIKSKLLLSAERNRLILMLNSFLSLR